MPLPTNDVAKLIMELMARGRSGGLPMQASPELTQYLAHAQGGTTPPQLRANPRADVLQGPGSGEAAIRDPNFLMNATEFDQSVGPLVNDAEGDAAWDRMMLRDRLPLTDTPLTRAQFDELYGGHPPPNAIRPPPDDPIDPMSLMTDDLNRPGRLPNQTFRQEGYGNFEGEPLFIWAKSPKTGKMIKIDGPFTNDIEAARELKMLRSSGLDVEVEIRPDWGLEPL